VPAFTDGRRWCTGPSRAGRTSLRALRAPRRASLYRQAMSLYRQATSLYPLLLAAPPLDLHCYLRCCGRTRRTPRRDLAPRRPQAPRTRAARSRLSPCASPLGAQRGPPLGPRTPLQQPAQGAGAAELAEEPQEVHPPALVFWLCEEGLAHQLQLALQEEGSRSRRGYARRQQLAAGVPGGVIGEVGVDFGLRERQLLLGGRSRGRPRTCMGGTGQREKCTRSECDAPYKSQPHCLEPWL